MKIGEKIRALRQQLMLTQSELADRAELSKGFISQVERDQTSPSIATLTDILECLGTDLTEFFSESDDVKVAYTPADMFEKDYAYGKIVWLVPNAQKNEMEPIMLNLNGGCCTEVDAPHVGQEFGLVLNGKIVLHLGEKRHYIKKGGTFYFEPKSLHYLENPGASPAQVIWISCPPSF